MFKGVKNNNTKKKRGGFLASTNASQIAEGVFFFGGIWPSVGLNFYHCKLAANSGCSGKLEGIMVIRYIMPLQRLDQTLF